jgi:hypothetical protein
MAAGTYVLLLDDVRQLHAIAAEKHDVSVFD